MLLVLTTAAGLVVWIVLWAIGVKGFDSFMITIVLLLLAAAMHIVWPFLPGNQRSRD